jgi:hypothetical protein
MEIFVHELNGISNGDWARDKCRFNVLFDERLGERLSERFGEKFEVKQRLIKKIQRPSYSNGRWNDIRIDFYDLYTQSITEFLFEVIEYMEAYKIEEKPLCIDIKLQSLDPVGAVSEEIIIKVDDFDVNFGDYDKESINITEPYLIIKPLKVMLNYS